MEDIGTNSIEYISPSVKIIHVSNHSRICEGSNEFDSKGTEIPGMKDNDWE